MSAWGQNRRHDSSATTSGVLFEGDVVRTKNAWNGVSRRGQAAFAAILDHVDDVVEVAIEHPGFRCAPSGLQ